MIPPFNIIDLSQERISSYDISVIVKETNLNLYNKHIYKTL